MISGGFMDTGLWRNCLFCIALIWLVPFSASAVNAENKMILYTVNYPLTYFAERIGGEHINVVFPAPPDVDPAFWSPDAETVRKYQQADLIILNGAGYEKWTKKVSLPMLRSIDTSRDFKDNLIHIESTVTHSHGPGGDHSHGGTAFTTWLDFSQGAQQAEAIYKVLSRKDPGHKADFEKNFANLKKDLLGLDDRLKSLSRMKPETPLVASHPIYQYMARRYNLSLKMVMWEPDADPGKAEWQEMQNLLKNHPAAWMIWEGDPLAESVEKLNEMNVQGVVFSPCFAKPDKGDFLSVKNQNIDNLAVIFN